MPTLGPERGRRQGARRSSAPSRSATTRCGPGCYDPDRPARGHGPRRHPRVAVLPVVPRFCGQLFWEAERPELRARLPAGLQRLDDRRVVRRRARPLHPAGAHPAVGPGARGRGDGAVRGEGRDRVRVLGEPRAARPAHDPRPGPLLGPGDGRGAGHCRWSCRMHVGSSSTDADDLVRRARSSPTSPSGAIRAAGTMLAWLFSDYFERMPGAQDRAVGGRTSAGCRTSSSGPSRSSTSSGTGRRTRASQFYENDVDTRQAMADLDTLDVRATFRDHIFGCFIEETHGICGRSTSSARTT